MKPRTLHEYHVFLASPRDMDVQRQEVRRFFESFNRNTAFRWDVRFTVVDWENYSTIGIGRPQDLITKQTLEKFRDSLVLMIGLMGQRFGSPTGESESGTEEEFHWALASYKQTGFPEIKWFFRQVDKFESSSNDPKVIREDLEQWIKVRAFRDSLENSNPPIFYQSFSDASDFSEKFREDLSRWLNGDNRPWYRPATAETEVAVETVGIPVAYFRSIVADFQILDIAGIDNDRVVEIPLSDVYVRLRVIRDEDMPSPDEDTIEGEPMDIHAALGKYNDLVIVGDPGSGKSTFLKFIALMLARAEVEDDPGLANAKLNLQAPLPIPFFVSLWDLSDYLKETKRVTESVILDFIVQQLAERRVPIEVSVLEAILEAGSCCLLFDGLDEVATERGRAVISRLVESFVQAYPKNRFVVTSRVRGYTGDTILKGDFVRCDIQDFNDADREEFLKNWFSALLRVDRTHVLDEGSQSSEAFESLRSAIEGKDRIRLLAVNPLLMTVIAIVHWNRKRLPDQRVDLYDECVDVLLGQRKLAERTARIKSTEMFDETAEEEIQYDRTWTRKRFSEIALRIQESGTDEITRDIVLAMLRQRFRDRPGTNDELATIQAERFLDRQELRSGLLVSRRSHSCRFVHLTFQEYLASWHLANLGTESLRTAIVGHLRDPQWFETLQLLGGELAKVSDEKLDQYVGYLLNNLGITLREQAPIIALCANILQDIKDVADVSPKTQEHYISTLQGTLDAFKLDSGVPAKTQLEVLAALIPLGASVKEHLIQATKSSHFAVRKLAVTTLVPHLPDDDLFAMTHVLKDRSQEPVFAYLDALFERDKNRAIRLMSAVDLSGLKAAKAIAMLFWHFQDPVDRSAILPIFKRALASSSKGSLWDIAWYLRNRPIIWNPIQDEVRGWLWDPNEILRERSVTLMVLIWRIGESTTSSPERIDHKNLLYRIAVEDPAPSVRIEAISNLRDDNHFLRNRALEDSHASVRSEALRFLFYGYQTKKGTSTKHYDHFLLTRDFNWLHFLDPKTTISEDWARQCSGVLRIPLPDVEGAFKRLADNLPITLAF